MDGQRYAEPSWPGEYRLVLAVVLKHQIAMVTGGNSGIGYETVLALLRKNAKVYIAGRSEERVREAIESMQKQDPSLSSKFVDYIPLDLASLRSIEQCAKIYASKEQRLDLLFCSAGVMLPPPGSVTKEGIELQMGANALGHYYLTKLLLPQLRASAKASPTNPPRVCFTSSRAHHAGPSKGFDPEDPSGEKTSSLFLPASLRAYGSSKVRTDAFYGPLTRSSPTSLPQTGSNAITVRRVSCSHRCTLGC